MIAEIVRVKGCIYVRACAFCVSVRGLALDDGCLILRTYVQRYNATTDNKQQPNLSHFDYIIKDKDHDTLNPSTSPQSNAHCPIHPTPPSPTNELSKSDYFFAFFFFTFSVFRAGIFFFFKLHLQMRFLAFSRSALLFILE